MAIVYCMHDNTQIKKQQKNILVRKSFRNTILANKNNKNKMLQT